MTAQMGYANGNRFMFNEVARDEAWQRWSGGRRRKKNKRSVGRRGGRGGGCRGTEAFGRCWNHQRGDGFRSRSAVVVLKNSSAMLSIHAYVQDQ
ncbi:hypothetical protein PoB_007282900 [Plakobranchus ocellatus]|uniref:Uncharacterized protein n=1 Tax=Plakobranchus ocellatus TaxID=259542 RepID=A0AAV4DQ64_9GAST|nr:hypothetical protein PoB_007282900 [Plakobranchus ocellatus]